MRAPLVNWLSAGQRSHTESPQHCLVSRNTGVHIARSNSPDLSLVAYTTCGIINNMSTSCVFKTEEASAGRLVLHGA